MALLDFSSSSRPDQKGERALMSNAESDNLPGLHDTDPSKRNSGNGTPSYGTTEIDSRESLTKSLDEDAGYPPADHGRGAWLFLAGSFWLEGFVWALPYSYGVFKSYYAQHPSFEGQKSIAAVGTTTVGTAYFLSPFAVVVLQRWPASRKPMSIVGLVFITAGLLAASFATTVVHLIFTQGLLQGLGTAMVYNPYIFYLDDWFIKRKGLAYGVFWSGTGVWGALVPLIMERALNTYGFRNTLRVWAIVTFVALGLLIFLLGPRRPMPAKTNTLQSNIGFLGSMVFWLFQIGNIFEGFGYFMPQIYLPSYAIYLGFSDVTAILSVSLLNATATFGMIFTGILVDRFHISTVLFISAIGSAMSVFLLWGFAVKEPILYSFAITYGVFAGGYTASWSGSAAEVRKDYAEAETAVIIGVLAAGRGFGCILGGPLSEELMRIGKEQNGRGFAYGTKFGSLIIFTGITMLLGRFGLVGRFGTQARHGKPPESGSEEDPLLNDSANSRPPNIVVTNF